MEGYHFAHRKKLLVGWRRILQQPVKTADRMFRGYIAGVPGRFCLGACNVDQRQHQSVRIFERQH